MKVSRYHALASIRWIAGALALAGVVLLLVLQVREDDAPNATTLGLVAIGLLLLGVVLMPRALSQAVERVTTVKVAGFEVSLGEAQRAQRVERRLPKFDDGVRVPPRPETGDDAVDVLKVQDVARHRLRFIRRALLDLPGDFDYVDTIAHLHDDELLDTDEVRLLLDVLDESVRLWPAETRLPFLDAAWTFAYRLGGLVFDRHVRKALGQAKWRIAEFSQSPNHRPDFLAFRDGECLVAAARVARPWDSLEPSRERLAGEVPSEVTRRIVVVPDNTRLRADGLHPEVDIVPLSEMLKSGV